MGVQLDDQRPLLTPPGEGEIVTDRPERTLRILGELDELIVTWFRYEPGEKGPDAHVHHHHTDAFYVLEGELELTLGRRAGSRDGAAGHVRRRAAEHAAHVPQRERPSPSSSSTCTSRRRASATTSADSNPSFDQHDPPPDGGRPFADAVFTRPDEAETLRHTTSLHRILCDLPQLTAIDMTFEPEFEGVDPHTHADHADAFYVLEGQVEFRVGDEPRVAGPGTFVAAPPGTVHGFRVAGLRADPLPQPARAARRVRRPPPRLGWFTSPAG